MRISGRAFAGGVNEHDHDEFNPDALPNSFRSKGRSIGRLVKIADAHGLYVSALGAERYLISDLRGRIVLKSGTFQEALTAIEGS